jgi:hypothetical protein
MVTILAIPGSANRRGADSESTFLLITGDELILTASDGNRKATDTPLLTARVVCKDENKSIADSFPDSALSKWPS